MKFAYRLAYYLIGVLIGCIFVVMVFGGRDISCNYFPNARVLDNIRNKPFEYSERASKVLAESWIDTIDIKNTLKYGDVNFDKSSTDMDKEKVYVIEGKTVANQEIIITITNKENKAILENILKK